jgi:rubrerythrin
MFDPVSISVAFGAAQAAMNGVKKCVEFYREGKKLAQDVSGIADEVGAHLGKFLDAQEQLQDVQEELKKNPPKGKSLNSMALDNVLKMKQTEKFEAELRQMIIYEINEPGLWDAFSKERKRLRDEKQERIARELKEQVKQRLKRRQFLAKIENYLTYSLASVLVMIVFCALMFGLHLDYKAKQQEHFDRKVFEERFVKEPKLLDCWVILQGSDMLPSYCFKDK